MSKITIGFTIGIGLALVIQATIAIAQSNTLIIASFFLGAGAVLFGIGLVDLKLIKKDNK